MHSGHRLFVITFLGTSLGLTASVILLNVVVDPHAVFGTQLLPALVRTDRGLKLDLIDRRALPVKMLILGSSRIMTIDPDDVREVTGLSAINLGVGSCRAEEYLIFTKYFTSKLGKPSIILLGIDVEAFHDKLPIDERWKKDFRAGQLLPQLQKASHKQFFDDIAQVVSYDMFSDSIRSIMLQWAPEDSLPSSRFTPDGALEYPLWTSMRSHGTFNLAEHINDSKKEYLDRFREYGGLSEWRKQSFEMFLEECRKENITVIAFITTLHPSVVTVLQGETKYAQIKSQLLEYLKQLSNRYSFVLYDFSDLHEYGGDMSEFWDGAHITRQNSLRLLNFVVRNNRSIFSSGQVTSHVVQQR
jgi:hypothetical protein